MIIEGRTYAEGKGTLSRPYITSLGPWRRPLLILCSLLVLGHFQKNLFYFKQGMGLGSEKGVFVFRLMSKEYKLSNRHTLPDLQKLLVKDDVKFTFDGSLISITRIS